MPQKSPKLPPKTSQSHQNDVPRATQSRQNIESCENMKSNENIYIYYTFEGLGHQNSPELPFNNQENTWLQSTCDLGLFKSVNIWKSDPEQSPMGDQKSIKNRWKSILVPSECTLAPNHHRNNEKVVSQDPECLKNGPPDLEKSINLWSKMNEICLKRIMQLLTFPMISILQIFQIHQVCKSTVNWLPEGPAAGAKP